MIGTEAERQFYLAQAGIRMWYAREPLPGAAPSADFDFTELDAVPAPIPEPESLPAQPSEKTERNKDHIAKLQSLMEPKKSSASAPAPPPIQAPASTDPTQDDSPDVESPDRDTSVSVPGDRTSRDIPRVTLQTWVGKRVMLVAPLSDESSLALQQTLAVNILNALGEWKPETLDIIRWPLFNNAGISLNHTDHLVDVLSAQLKGHDDKVVILLGEGGEWFDAALNRQPDLSFSATLANLAGTPKLKRELWQLLKPFRPGPV